LFTKHCSNALDGFRLSQCNVLAVHTKLLLDDLIADFLRCL
jgi:hypothetical protein